MDMAIASSTTEQVFSMSRPPCAAKTLLYRAAKFFGNRAARHSRMGRRPLTHPEIGLTLFTASPAYCPIRSHPHAGQAFGRACQKCPQLPTAAEDLSQLRSG